MKLFILKTIVVLFVILHFAFLDNNAYAATSITRDGLIPSVWTKAGSPYIISYDATALKKIIIEPGVVVKFTSTGGIVFLYGASIKGTDEEKIVFTSIKDDSAGGDTNKDADATKPNRKDAHSISFPDYSDTEIENARISYMDVGLWISRYTSSYPYFPANIKIKNVEISNNNNGIFISNSAPFIENCLIGNNNVGVRAINDMRFENTALIKNSSIVNNGIGLDSKITYHAFNRDIFLDVRNNWWGDKAGPYFKHPYDSTKDNLNTNGDVLQGDGMMFDPWTGKEAPIEDPGCQENCFSNVMFLPGIKASRLYKDGSLGSEDKLWPPNYFGNDLDNLALDDNGKSINNVYTRDAIDEVAIPYVGGNIYKTFLQKLEDLKDDKTINDYESFAYDWRQNVEDVAKNGTPYKGAVKSAIADIETLSQSSKSKKVTIVAHSNGGLLAKAIMLELKEKGLEDKVDKIIFVGTPQMGTPLSILSLLYGYDESALFGTLISREDSRTLAENMPGAYGLLPSSKYFDRMENPFITFSSQQTRYKKFMDAYGEKISSNSEFKDFLLGKEGREKPDGDEVEKENILNEKLITQAGEMHERLDNWTPPEGLEVIQIAGWGLDTVSGVKYSEKEKTDCYMADSKIPSCIGIGEYEPIYEPQFTVDGDKVVVAPSALMMANSDKIKKYWMDLYTYNDNSIVNREHKDVLEINSIQQFVENLIKNDSSPLSENIMASRPNPEGYDDAKPRLRMSLYSPLDIHLYDEQGNHTGPKKIMIDGHEKTVFEEGIPNSYYQQFGERKSVGFEEGQNIKVVMEGYDLGTYTLKFDEIEVSQDGEKILSSATLSNLPTTDKTTVSFEIPETGLADMTTLKADMDSDGKNEYEIDKNIGKEISLLVTLEMISQNVDHLAKLNFITSSKTQEFLQIKIKELIHDKEMIEKLEEKNNKIPKANEIRLLNKKIDDLVDFIEDKFDLDMTAKAQEILIHDLKSVKM